MKKFAILTNLRDENDIPLVFPECKKKLPSFKVLSTFNVFGKVEGEIIVLGLTGKEMMLNPKVAAEKVLEATIFAQERGAELIGLTSLTSSVTMQGKWLQKRQGVKIALTHGDTYAAGITLEGLEKIAFMMGRNLKEMTVAVVGAYGLIGKAISTKLTTMCAELILIGPNPNKLDRLYHNLPVGLAKVTKSTEINEVNRADIIVTATSNPNALITPAVFKDDRKIVIYEVSVPPNLPEATYIEIKKQFPNIVRVDGAMVLIPGVDLGGEITGVAKGTTYACWAETIMQALENDSADHVGEIDFSHLEKTLLWGRKYGFLHAPFSCFGTIIPNEEFKMIKYKKIII
jgi:predicted amino acid dehydrogenase